jgi:hypothetical protein
MLIHLSLVVQEREGRKSDSEVGLIHGQILLAPIRP